MAPSILIIGLPHTLAPDPEFGEKIRLGVEKAGKDIAGAGYDYMQLAVNPETEGNQPFTDALNAKKWDAVLIGFGVRGIPKFTVFFEWLVNESVKCAPSAKLGFPTSPENAFDCAKRLAPI